MEGRLHGCIRLGFDTLLPPTLPHVVQLVEPLFVAQVIVVQTHT